VDVNGDGVIDHIALAQGGHEAADTAAPLLHHVQTRRHTALGACIAFATSGIPPNEELWAVDVCARRHALDEALLPVRGDEDGGGFVNAHGDARSAGLSFAPPAFLPVPHLDGSYSHLKGQHGIIAVLSSDGVVTALSRHGVRLWQVRRLCEGALVCWVARGLKQVSDCTACSPTSTLRPTTQHTTPHHTTRTIQRFLEVGWDEDLTAGVVPSLLPLALRNNAVPAALLAVGADAAVVVSEHGYELARLSLAFYPLAPPVVADFDGDGLNDLLFVTPGGLFGYTQVQHL